MGGVRSSHKDFENPGAFLGLPLPFPLMATADWPGWYTLLVAPSWWYLLVTAPLLDGGLRDLKLILCQLPGFSCWTDRT